MGSQRHLAGGDLEIEQESRSGNGHTGTVVGTNLITNPDTTYLPFTALLPLLDSSYKQPVRGPPSLS